MHTQHPLVSPLLAGLLSPSLPTTHACCSALVAAASCSWVARHATITTLVSQAASMTAYPLAVRAIGELLLCEVRGSTVLHTKYNCPYSLRWVHLWACVDIALFFVFVFCFSSFFVDLQDKHSSLCFCPELSSWKWAVHCQRDYSNAHSCRHQVHKLLWIVNCRVKGSDVGTLSGALCSNSLFDWKL